MCDRIAIIDKGNLVALDTTERLLERIKTKKINFKVKNIDLERKLFIEDAKFKTFGCGSAIASSSLITEWVKGKNLDEAHSIKNTEIANHLALPPVKIHCSILAEDAIKAAIDDYKKKNRKNR